MQLPNVLRLLRKVRCCAWAQDEMGDRIVAHDPGAEAAPKRRRKSGKSGWKSWREKREAAEIRLGLEKAQAENEAALLKVKLEARSPSPEPVQDSVSSSSGLAPLALPVVAPSTPEPEENKNSVPRFLNQETQTLDWRYQAYRWGCEVRETYPRYINGEKPLDELTPDKKRSRLRAASLSPTRPGMRKPCYMQVEMHPEPRSH